MSTPYIFIGCSHEVTDQADGLERALRARFESRAEVELWSKQGVFNESSVLIVELEGKATRADFAVFLVTRTSTGEASPNVLFELGLFMGGLERYRTVIVWDEQVELPSDLGGVIVLPLSEGIDQITDKIADNVERLGPRIRPEIELGSLERMLNVCTPGYADHLTPGVRELNPRPDGSERFSSAGDFYEICRCLLHRYVIGSMSPAEMTVLRAYFAVYLGDGIGVEVDGERHAVRSCGPYAGRDDAEASFVVALSNPRHSGGAADEHTTGHDLGTLYATDWRIGMPVAGYAGDRPASTCASAFKDRSEVRGRPDDVYNVAVEDEAEVIAIPVLWIERGRSASIGVLAISSAAEGLTTTYEPWVRRLRLVANVLGVAVDRLSREPLEEVEPRIGIDIDEPPRHWSFARRAVAVRRAIAEYAASELVHRGVVTVEAREGEHVLTPVG